MLYFYYDEYGQKYFSRFDALSSNRKINLYFYDKEFRQYNWNIEPTEKLSELYKLRAQQLRDSYDYLILAYSGGIDSTNILETFYYNNIHIDEVMMVGAFSQDSYHGSDENHNGEIYKNCVSLINNINLRNTKITYHDYTKSFESPEIISVYGNNERKYNTIDGWCSPHHWWWKDIDIVYKNVRGKKAIIFGIDKPNYCVDDITKKPYFTFDSLLISQYGNSASLIFQSDLTREFFYWSPDMPKLLIKQLHVIDNFYKNNYILKDFLNKNYLTVIEKLIYPNIKNKLIFKSPKSPSTHISLRDSYLRNKKHSKIFIDFANHLKWIKQNHIKVLNINQFEIKSLPYFI